MPTYNKGDFTQQGVDGYVDGSLELNQKRIVDVRVSSDDESETISDVNIKIRDELNDLEYDITGSNLATGENVIGGGGGGDSPFVYIKVNITNADTTHDLYDYDGNNTNPSLKSYFKDGDGSEISPYFTTVNGQINNLTAGSGNIVATKNGGTGIIYLIPTSCEKYINGSWTNIKEFQIGMTQFCTELASVDNVTITDDGYMYYFKLTDDTKIGEVNATLVGYIQD